MKFFNKYIDNPIKQEHLQKLRNDLNICDSLEDKIAMDKIIENRRRKIIKFLNIKIF